MENFSVFTKLLNSFSLCLERLLRREKINFQRTIDMQFEGYWVFRRYFWTKLTVVKSVFGKKKINIIVKLMDTSFHSEFKIKYRFRRSRFISRFSRCDNIFPLRRLLINTTVSRLSEMSYTHLIIVGDKMYAQPHVDGKLPPFVLRI